MSLIISVGVFDINERKTIFEAIQKQILKFENFKTSNKKKKKKRNPIFNQSIFINVHWIEFLSRELSFKSEMVCMEKTLNVCKIMVHWMKIQFFYNAELLLYCLCSI